MLQKTCFLKLFKAFLEINFEYAPGLVVKQAKTLAPL